ncbi:hypothetical protein BH09SUM1_BH09SUM1_14210 [soil metagenome]
MLIPERAALAKVVAMLANKRIGEGDAIAYAVQVYEALKPHQTDHAYACCQYLLTAPLNLIIDFVGPGAPDIGEMAMIRNQLSHLLDQLKKDQVTVEERQLKFLRETMEEKGKYHTASSSRTSTPTLAKLNTPTPLSISTYRSSSGSNQLPGGTASRSGSGSAQKINEPLAPITPGAYYGLEYADITRRGDFYHYLAASVALGVTIMLVETAANVNWPPLVQHVVAAAVPVCVMGFWAFTRHLKFILWLRWIFLWLSICGLLFGIVVYTRSLWNDIRALQNYDVAGVRIDATANALERYKLRIGVFPQNLNQLYSPINFLEKNAPAPEELFRDPFSIVEDPLLYTKNIDTYYLRSVGPMGAEQMLALPMRPSKQFREDLSSISYDPTNGAISEGNIFRLSHKFLAMKDLDWQGKF